MKFSEQWLREWVNPNLASEALGHLLTMAGLEVESQASAAPAFSGVVVAEVKSVRKHENADRLRVCEVDIGSGELQQIVCGAPNVSEGAKVPCATLGAVLPGDFKIKATKMRGVASNGMLCSGQELGIPDGVDGLLLLPADAPVGVNLRDYLALDDTVIELKITPNRADCLSIRGIAREVAALTTSPLQAPTIIPVPVTITSQRTVKLAAGAACGRYLGRVIEQVNAQAPTPAWMKQRLERAGVRSISAVVDVTNFVLLELGQPLHAFDHNKLQGDIEVRFPQAGERMTLLNGKEIAIDADMLLITDQTGPVALAGVMGGANSEVDDNTTAVFLESAFFAPEAIAGRARRLGFSSDASFRYERGVDFTLQAEAMERTTALIIDICGGVAGPVVEQVTELPARKPVAVRVDRVNRVLGMSLTATEMAAIFARLGLPFEQQADSFIITPPAARFDLVIEEDFIEEIARVYGYDAIPADNIRGRLAMLPLPEQQTPRAELRRVLVQRDYQEVVTYAFVDEQWENDFAANTTPIRLINPIASQMSVMRSTLLGGLLDTLSHNLKRKQNRVRVFEMARVFLKTATGEVEQPEKLAGLAYGTRFAVQWSYQAEKVDFFDVKADIEVLFSPRQLTFRRAAHPALHPGRCAEVLLDGKVVGILGELHPQWVQKYDLVAAPIYFELDLQPLLARHTIQAQAVSRFPAVRRDLALVVADTLEVDALATTLRAAASHLVTEIALFDVYRGKGVEEGKKSLAFKVLMQDTARTLTDAEVDSVMQDLIAAAANSHAAQLRL
ncbi:phenylalanine--tRNA ligase subunit beta [Aquaspirillum serpens]|uniref:phenylalanine--tRNA ligase subunit beta n=1 Tax=Aquaspirillum serpens TaxID=190 RepID=UPI0003B424A8|nr:phenylalanine--tRNA ligase subunit beta [Aquaspirillum serpens]